MKKDKSKIILIIINIIVLTIMTINVSIRYFEHLNHIEYSTPASIEFINCIFYVIPLIIFNVIWFIIKLKNK